MFQKLCQVFEMFLKCLPYKRHGAQRDRRQRKIATQRKLHRCCIATWSALNCKPKSKRIKVAAVKHILKILVSKTLLFTSCLSLVVTSPLTSLFRVILLAALHLGIHSKVDVVPRVAPTVVLLWASHRVNLHNISVKLTSTSRLVI